MRTLAFGVWVSGDSVEAFCGAKVGGDSVVAFCEVLGCFEIIAAKGRSSGMKSSDERYRGRDHRRFLGDSLKTKESRVSHPQVVDNSAVEDTATSTSREQVADEARK